jgi:DDE superfamily endonuclease/Helix-turn-helix of DDE superfamily endonuclease
MLSNKIIMNIDKVLSDLRMSRALIGLSKDKFEELLKAFTQILIETRTNHKRQRKLGGGRNGKIKSAKQKLFFVLFYLKNYPTFDVCAFLFASSKTSTCDWVQEILPLLRKTLGREILLPKRQIRTPEEFFQLFPGVKEVMLDGVERPTVRSKKDKTQKKNYSGKKKRPTRKNNLIVDKTKKVLILTPTKHGRVHDKKMSDKFSMITTIPEGVSILADTGFIGIQKQHPNTLIPKKRTLKNPLTELDKQFNKLISSTRMAVENAIGGVKRYGVVSKIFRNKKGIDDLFMEICCGLWNLHLRTA